MLVRALGTYKSRLTFDRIVLVEMFETGLCGQKVNGNGKRLQKHTMSNNKK